MTKDDPTEGELGALPLGWVWTRLDALTPVTAPIVYGIIQPGPHVADGVPFVRPVDIQNGAVRIDQLPRTSRAVAHDYRRSALEPGDVVYSIVGTIGKALVVPDALRGGNITQSSVRLRPLPPISSSSLFTYALDAPPVQSQIRRFTFGNAVQRLNVDHMRRLMVPLMPANEQRRLIAKLDELRARSDRAREALGETLTLLDHLRRSVLAAAFRGDLTAAWRAANPDVEPASASLVRVREKRGNKAGRKRTAGRSEVADSTAGAVDFGNLPTTWELASLRDVAQLQPGYAFKSVWYSSNGVRLLRGTNIVPGSTRWDDVVHLPEDHASTFQDYLLVEGDLVIAMDRPIVSDGLKVARLRIGDVPSLLLQRVGRFRRNEAVTADYLHGYLLSGYFLQQIAGQSTGTQLPHVSGNDIEAAPIPVPPIAEQHEVARRVHQALAWINESTDAVARALRELESVDQSVLAKAFRGDLLPQDANDEPAEAMLSRIRARNEAPTKHPRGRRAAAQPTS